MASDSELDLIEADVVRMSAEAAEFWARAEAATAAEARLVARVVGASAVCG